MAKFAVVRLLASHHALHSDLPVLRSLSSRPCSQPTEYVTQVLVCAGLMFRPQTAAVALESLRGLGPLCCLCTRCWETYFEAGQTAHPGPAVCGLLGWPGTSLWAGCFYICMWFVAIPHVAKQNGSMKNGLRWLLSMLSASTRMLFYFPKVWFSSAFYVTSFLLQ